MQALEQLCDGMCASSYLHGSVLTQMKMPLISVEDLITTSSRVHRMAVFS